MNLIGQVFVDVERLLNRSVNPHTEQDPTVNWFLTFWFPAWSWLSFHFYCEFTAKNYTNAIISAEYSARSANFFSAVGEMFNLVFVFRKAKKWAQNRNWNEILSFIEDIARWMSKKGGMEWSDTFENVGYVDSCYNRMVQLGFLYPTIVNIHREIHWIYWSRSRRWNTMVVTNMFSYP